MKDETVGPSIHPSSLILHPFELEAMKGVEPLSFGLQDRRSVYPIELHRRKILVELRGVEPLRPACKAGIIPLDHSPGRLVAEAGFEPAPFRL